VKRRSVVPLVRVGRRRVVQSILLPLRCTAMHALFVGRANLIRIKKYNLRDRFYYEIGEIYF